jgi:multidrug efflux pump subunit AcrA (membrane-fusion protein)
MDNVEDVRKALEEFVSPSLVEVKTQVAGLHAELASFKADSKADLTATEARLLKAIEAAKTEVLLMVRVSDLSARNAELEAKLAEFTKRESQRQ